MRQPGRGPRLAPEPFACICIAADVLVEGLERHGARQARIVRQVNDPHPPAANLVPDEVRAHHLSLRPRLSIVDVAGSSLGDGFEVLRVGVEQRDHSGAQLWFVGAQSVQVFAPLFRVELEGAREHLTNQPRLFTRGTHGG